MCALTKMRGWLNMKNYSFNNFVKELVAAIKYPFAKL